MEISAISFAMIYLSIWMNLQGIVIEEAVR